MRKAARIRSPHAVMTAVAAMIAFGAVASTQSVAPKGDWETLPPAFPEVEAAIKSAAISMDKAMSIAEQAAGGSATSGRVVVGSGGAITYEFVCSAGGQMKRVVVDGRTGQVTAATLTLGSAIAKALERVPGTVKMADGNLVADPPVYMVQVISGNRLHELTIDAISGAVVQEVVRGRFPGALADGEIVKTPSGLQFIEIDPGSGATPAGPTAQVKVHYTGYLVDGSKFDSSVDRGQPVTFRLDQVVKGWSEGVGSMKVGGKRKLIIPYALGYGEEGRGPIPPKATLIFDVELLGTN